MTEDHHLDLLNARVIIRHLAGGMHEGIYFDEGAWHEVDSRTPDQNLLEASELPLV